jgi:hypothetical protein
MHTFAAATLNTKQRFSECRLYMCVFVYACMYVCMGTSLAPERLDEFYSCLVFNSLYLIGRFTVNMNIRTLKVEALHRGPQTQIYHFLQRGSNDFY